MSAFDHDLHLHLYGCLSAEFLWNLAKSKPPIDWDAFEESYENQYGWRPSMADLLENGDEEAFKTFREIYVVDQTGPFLNFQAKFNLIIAIADISNPEEVGKVVQNVCREHHQQGLTHAEYRMLFRPDTKEELFEKQLISICEQLRAYESQSNSQFQGRLSMSLPRTKEVDRHYRILRETMKKHPVVAEMTTSIDFCFIEEGFPPKGKEAFFQQVLRDNAENPEHALAILYHVAESFNDKSVESAIRWVHESAQFGAHRLGHAIALGIDPYRYADLPYTESVEERLDQISYDLAHLESLNERGLTLDSAALEEEREALSKRPLDEKLNRTYSEDQIEALKIRQDLVIDYLTEKQICVESCPTSNFRIGMLDTPEQHPLHRFIGSSLPLALASDDPGIFNTTLMDEVAWVASEVSDSETVFSQLAENAKKFRSERLSGRW